MSNVSETIQKSEASNNANETRHYVLITISVVVGMIGVLLRFAGDWVYLDAISNIILVVGVILALKAVFDILK